MTLPALAPHLTWPEVLRSSGVVGPDGLPTWARQRIERMALAMWTPLREAWGGPLRIVSGFRTPASNAAAGGARRSQHTEGRALDLAPSDRDDTAELYDLADRLMREGAIPRGWICLYVEGTPAVPGPWRFVHVDCRGVRPRGGRHAGGRRVSYRRDKVT